MTAWLLHASPVTGPALAKPAAPWQRIRIARPGQEILAAKLKWSIVTVRLAGAWARGSWR